MMNDDDLNQKNDSNQENVTIEQKLADALKKWDEPAKIIGSAITSGQHSSWMRASYVFGVIAVLGATGITWASRSIHLGAISLVMTPFLTFTAITLRKAILYEKNTSESSDSDSR